jgi:hypothetical protein
VGTQKLLMSISCVLILAATNSFGQAVAFRNGTFPFGSLRQGPAPPKTLELSNPDGRVIGKVWFEQWVNGLVVYGIGTGTPSPWARFPLEMGSRTHLKLWLALADGVAMPDIGWGAQGGEQTCSTYDASRTNRPGRESCPDWEARQSAYRDQFRRLFIRRWDLGPHTSIEGFATPAYRDALRFADDYERPTLTRLVPSGDPVLDRDGSTGYGFQVFLPWSSLPPASSLELTHLFTTVEIWDGGKMVATTAPDRREDRIATFNRLEFERAVRSKITPCEYDLTQTNLYGVALPAWYFPASRGAVADTFALTNEAGGYRYDPEGLSPIAFWTHHFSINLGSASTVCGPDLRYVARGKTWSFDGRIDEARVKYLKLADGSYLLKSGPIFRSYSPFGNGRCGSCTVVEEEVFRLKPDTGVSKIFSESIRMDPPENFDLDIQFSADWKTIHVYKARSADGKEIWSSQQYCFSGETYLPCGEPSAIPPPRPRQINLTSGR